MPILKGHERYTINLSSGVQGASKGFFGPCAFPISKRSRRILSLSPFSAASSSTGFPYSVQQGEYLLPFIEDMRVLETLFHDQLSEVAPGLVSLLVPSHDKLRWY